MVTQEGTTEIGAGELSTSFCNNCRTVDGCACPVPVKIKRIFRSPPRQERADIVAFLRQGGDRPNGIWQAWDSETRSYAEAFAAMIERGDHRA